MRAFELLSGPVTQTHPPSLMPRSLASAGLISTYMCCFSSASHLLDRVSSPPPSYSTNRPDVRISGNWFAMDRNRVGQIPCDHSRFGVAIGRAAMLDRHALNPAGKVQRPGHGVGIGRIHALDDFHFLRREIFVPAELFEHAQSELWVSVLDFRANRIGTLREKIVVVLRFDLLPVLHHLALDDALDTEPGAEGAAALLHGKIGVVKDRRARMLELRRSPARPR